MAVITAIYLKMGKKTRMPEKGRYLIAVSGGPDSMALLDMARNTKLHIEAAHVNYHKRKTADRDEKIVRSYCRKHDIPLHVRNLYPENIRGNFQAYARQERYGFFAKICEKNGLDGVLVAHQLDDHIETYLMQKEKGLGVSRYGLRAENIISGVRVLRPLLNYAKDELVRYCQGNGIEYGIDESNLSDDYARNRIRHSRVERMTAKEKKELVREIERLNRQKDREEEVSGKYLEKGTYTVKQFLSLKHLKAFLHLHFPHRSDRYIEEMIRQLQSAEQCVFRGEDICLVKEYGRISVFSIPDDYAYVFRNVKQFKEKEYGYFALAFTGSSKEGVTLKKSDFPVTIRNVRKGDHIRMRYGTRKLNRFFIDEKIPLKDRLSWPVMSDRNGKIILVPGIGCDADHYSEKHDLFVLKL